MICVLNVKFSAYAVKLLFKLSTPTAPFKVVSEHD
jgi:hypothetical protein